MAQEGMTAKEAAGKAATDFMFGKEPEETPKSQETAPEAPDDEIEETEGVEAAEEESPAEAPPEAEGENVVEIEVDGELLEVPAKYKDYFMRQADYTQKTQQLSEQRKQSEILQGQLQSKAQEFEFAQSVWDDVLKVQELHNTAEQYNQYLRTNIDSLSSTDIEKIRLAIQDAKEESQNIATQVQQKQREFQQSQEQALTDLLNKGTEVLRHRIPGWGEDHQKQVRDFAIQTGFSEDEINSVVDPRQVEVLWKAKQYDDLLAGKAQAVKKVQAAPQVKAKSRNPMPKDVGDKLNLRKKLKNEKRDTFAKRKDMEDYMAKRFNI